MQHGLLHTWASASRIHRERRLSRCGLDKATRGAVLEDSSIGGQEAGEDSKSREQHRIWSKKLSPRSSFYSMAPNPRGPLPLPCGHFQNHSYFCRRQCFSFAVIPPSSCEPTWAGGREEAENRNVAVPVDPSMKSVVAVG